MSFFYDTTKTVEVSVVEDKSDGATDEKIIYSEPGVIQEGDVLIWGDTNWIVFQEEKNTIDDYNKFFIIESLSNIKFLIEGIPSKEHPVSFMKTNMDATSRMSSRYSATLMASSSSIIVNKNVQTDKLELQDELVVGGHVWKIESINKYESQSVIIFELIEQRISNSDDIFGGIANTKGELEGTSSNDGVYDYVIVGDNKITIETTNTYEARKIDSNGDRVIPNLVTFSTTSDLVTLTQVGNKVEVAAGIETGTLTLEADIDGNISTIEIKVVGFWG